MNLWMLAAFGFAMATLPCGVLLIRARFMDALVALQFGTGAVVLALAAMAIAMHRPSFLDVALTLALLAYPSGLVFAHFMERWL